MTRSALALSIAAALGGSSFAVDAMAQQIQGPPTSPATFSSSPALAIPDNSPGTPACDIIDASAIPAGATIDDVEAVTGIDHTWVGDLIITLESPAATTVTLLDRPNVPLGTFGCSNNDVNVRFADGEADPEAVCSGTPPQGNTADPWPVTDASPVPGNAMADFDGEDPSGNWTLCVSDNAAGDTGTIQTWEVTIGFTLPDPAVSLSVPSVNFGNQGVGSPSAPSTVTIENTGGASLDLGTLSLIGANPGDFGISADSCSGASVAPAATCSFDVTATPSAVGVSTASVDIPSNAPSSPDNLPLEVTGVSGTLAINPASVNFGAIDVGNTTAATTVTVENTGTADVVVGTLGISGANAGDFGLSADGCSGATLTPAATCTFDVAMTPSAAGARNAQVDIPSDAPSSPDSVPLAGTGNPLAPAVSVPVNSAWTTIVLAGMLGLFGWLGLRRMASPAGRRKM